MEKEFSIIREVNEFKKFNALVEDIFNKNHRFPEQVFSDEYSRYIFEEFDYAMSKDFWQTIRKLAINALDSYILMAVIEPSPTEYFKEEFGYYNWFKLPVKLTETDYWSILDLGPTGSPADALLFNSEVVVWVSPSKKWAIWGERSYGICVLATTNTSDPLEIDTWFLVDEALEGVVSLNFANQKVPTDFANTLKKNYQIK